MANITKRGNTYRIKISCGYDVSGKQVVKSITYKPDPTKSERWNEKELQRQAVLFEEQCKQGQSVTAAKFETFAREWFKDYAELRLKRQTLHRYHQMEKRAYAALGHIRVDKITPLDIQRYVRSLMADGLAPQSVKINVRFVSVIFTYAVKKRIIPYNPCATVDYPTGNSKQFEFYTVDEVKKLFELLQNEKEDKKPFALFFTLAAYTGCRKGEILGIEWKDLDFDNNTLSINRAYCYNSTEKYYTDTPKTQSSYRILKLPDHVMETLSQHRQWQNKQREICGGTWVDSDRVLTAWNGEPMRPHQPNCYLNKLCKRTGMRKVTIHSFRHFNASVLIDSGIDVVTVQKALGHSTAATTLNVYSHAFNHAQTRAMEAIANVIDL